MGSPCEQFPPSALCCANSHQLGVLESLFCVLDSSSHAVARKAVRGQYCGLFPFSHRSLFFIVWCPASWELLFLLFCLLFYFDCFGWGSKSCPCHSPGVIAEVLRLNYVVWHSRPSRTDLNLPFQLNFSLHAYLLKLPIKGPCFLQHCYGLNVCAPPHSYVEILMPNMVILVGEAFQRCLSHEDGALMSGISSL